LSRGRKRGERTAFLLLLFFSEKQKKRSKPAPFAGKEK